MKKNKNTKRIILSVLILVMLAAIAVSVLWLGNRGEKLNEADRHDHAMSAAETASEGAQEAIPSEDDLVSAEAAMHVYSHRGSAGDNEHTFEAYDAAIEAGSHYIEQDLVISSDGVLYVSHDLNTYQMTGRGADYSSLTSEEIDQIRTRAGNSILRMSDVFDKYGSDVNYVIELKSSGADMIEAFEKLVDSCGYQDRITVQSEDTDVLQTLEEKYPDMPKLFICKSWDSLLGCLDMPYVDIVSVRKASNLMTEKSASRVHESGKLFSAWTLNSEEDIRRAIELGVDTYFTDDTALAIRLEKELRCKIRMPRTSAFVFAASDFQVEPGWQTPADNLRGILRSVAADGRSPDNVIYCGDYTNDPELYDYQLGPDDSIAEIRKIVGEECSYADQDDLIFVQGNHDKMTDALSASGLHEFDDYLVYVVNTENDFPWKQGRDPVFKERVIRASEEMKACFDKLIAAGETRPVFIAGHVPLHFSGRTSSLHGSGDNMFAEYIFNVVNSAAEDLDIVYFTGHNHNKGWDCYLGGSCIFLAPGETILIPDAGDNTASTDAFTEQELNFTYMNAGYTGYYMNCGQGEPTEQYRAADETLTGTVCEITPGEIIIRRYSADGEHQLRGEGEGDPYKGGIDSGLIDSSHYSKALDSPYTIKRKTAE